MAKILALVSFKIFPPHMGGQKGVAFFYEYLGRHHDIFMVASRDNTDPGEASYPVQPVLYPNKNMAGNLFQLTRLKQLIREKDIDCIIAEHSYTGWLAYLLKKITGKPFIIHSHNLESYRFRQMKRRWWKFYWQYEKRIHQEADHSFFISEDDRDVAMKEFKLNKEKCTVAPYGIEPPTKIAAAREVLKQQLATGSDYIFYFNGTLDYEPNMEAVKNLVGKLNPILQKKQLDYTIVISGKRLSPELQNRIRKEAGIVYIDFAKDLELLYQGSDLFLNAVTNDSGVKTKLVEAIANNCTAISTEAGATGIRKEICGNKLITVSNNDWDIFADKIVENIGKPKEPTPPVFYSYYSWETIAAQAANKLDEVIRNQK